MTGFLDRQMEQFQHRVQQKITLADDEIQRLSTHLSMLQTDIFDTKDQLNRTQLKTAQLSQEVSGREKVIRAHTETILAKMRTDHHIQMQEVQAKQNQEISALHQSFNEMVSELERVSVQAIAKKTSAIDHLLEQTQSRYSQLQAKVSGSDSELDLETARDLESLQSIEMSRQERLEAQLQSRNEERLQSLLQAKSRLSDCVVALEEMEHNHKCRMATFKSQLDAMDTAYTEKVTRAKERQQRLVDTLTRREAQYTERARSLERIIRKIQRHHTIQVETAVAQGETLQKDVVAADATSQAIADQKARIDSWEAKKDQLRKRLEAGENELTQARMDNETMKREIARLQYEARAARRSPVLANGP
jgi:chromosome segregation ATPase